MAEYIFKIDGVLVDDDGEACMHPEYVGELIICQECVHSDGYNHCTRLSIWNKPEDFCSYGERKEE